MLLYVESICFNLTIFFYPILWIYRYTSFILYFLVTTSFAEIKLSAENKSICYQLWKLVKLKIAYVHMRRSLALAVVHVLTQSTLLAVAYLTVIPNLESSLLNNEQIWVHLKIQTINAMTYLPFSSLTRQSRIFLKISLPGKSYQYLCCLSNWLRTLPVHCSVSIRSFGTSFASDVTLPSWQCGNYATLKPLPIANSAHLG